jgi:hypothetical protein
MRKALVARLSTTCLLGALLLAAGPAPKAPPAKGGALPKGDPAALDKGKESGPKVAPEKSLACLDAFAKLPGGNALFADGAYFVLAQTSTFGKASDPTRPTVKHTLFKLDLAKRSTEPLLSLEHKSAVGLSAYGAPVSSVAAAAFLGAKSACFEGPAAIVNATVSKQGEQAVRTTGTFAYVEMPAGRRLVDEKKRQLIDVDGETFQTKLVRRLPDGERALFFDPVSRDLVTWRDAGTVRGLVAYRSDDDAKPRRLAIAKGDRVVQQLGRFAVMRAEPKSNSIVIRELAGWTGPKSVGKTFTLALPKQYAVTGVALEANFDKRVAVVYPIGFAAQRRWQRALIYDYATGKSIGQVTASGNDFLHSVGLDPSGRYVVAEVRDQTSRQSVALRVFDLTTQKSADASLKAP